MLALPHRAAISTRHIIMGKLDWRVVGLAMGSFLAVSYVACVAYDLAFDQQA